MVNFWLLFTGYALQILSLATWVGGLVFFALIAAPSVFVDTSSRLQSGSIVGTMLRRFHVWEGIAGLMLLSGAGFFYLAGLDKPLLWVDITAALVMFINFAAYGGYIMPLLDTIRMKMRDDEMFSRETDSDVVRRFVRMNNIYRAMLVLNIAIGVILGVVIAYMAAQGGSVPEQMPVDTTLFGGQFGGML